MLISLNEKKHGPTAKYIAELRRRLPERFPDTEFFFQPADIVTQILNFGLSAPIDVQVVGRSPQNYAITQDLAKKIKAIPGAADVFIRQVVDAPSIDVTVDRDRASGLGLTQSQVANNVLITLSGSGQTAPNYWLDPKNGGQLSDRHPVSAVSGEHAGRSREHSGHRSRARRRGAAAE